MNYGFLGIEKYSKKNNQNGSNRLLLYGMKKAGVNNTVTFTLKMLRMPLRPFN
jgi:hypothetical protein